jgi:branched-chain amino acid aminotransferase
MIRGDFVVVNNQLVKTNQYVEPVNAERVVYEVMRVVDGLPLFFSEHFNRLMHSCQLVGVSAGINEGELFRQIRLLSETNGFSIGNIQLKLFFKDGTKQVVVHYLPHSYPTETDYREGVKMGILEAERTNPEAKVVQASIRERANQLMAETGVYEVMLVDGDQTITEGSRSNLVFIKNNALYTAPLFKVLKGVTLAKVLEIAQQSGITVHFTNIALNDLDKYEALFITGTSPQVLPVSRVGDLSFNVNHPLLKTMASAFLLMVNEDIERRKHYKE